MIAGSGQRGTGMRPACGAGGVAAAFVVAASGGLGGAAGAGCGAWRRRARRSAADAARGGGVRPDRHVGRRRHRGLAVAHGDAAEERRRQRAAQRRRTQGGRGVGSGSGQRGRQPVPRLRRRGRHASAAPRADLVAGRSHVEARDGRRTADAASSGLRRQLASPPVVSATMPAERTWQGVSTAEWVKQAQSSGLGLRRPRRWRDAAAARSRS